MSRYLLDVNVLVALLDPSHLHHERAHRWFEHTGAAGWLSCPTTQNGVLRIVSNVRYSNSQPVSVVWDSLASLLSAGSHEFVPDALSLLGGGIERKRLLTSAQITDTYLLAVAVSHQARLATFDTKLVTTAVVGGATALEQIG